MMTDVRSKKQEVRSLASGSAAGAVSALSAPQARSAFCQRSGLSSVNEAVSGLSAKRSVSYSDLIGKDFKCGGRGPLEYDCYGLAMEIYRRLGIELPDFGSSPSVSWIHHKIIEETAEGREHRAEGSTPCPMRFAPCPGPEPFCLVTFMLRPPYTSHIGVVLEDGVRFMHILRKTEVTIERLDSQLWERRITGYFVPQGAESIEQRV